jgi:heme A synthase
MIKIRAHHAAALACAVTFSLLLLGNVVWGTGSSLACPDWPTCYGSFFPEMSGGVLYEHSHRLLGAAVGMLTITLAVMLGIERAPRRLRIAGFVAVVVVVFQGVLGGLTVLLRLPALVSVAHLATAMGFFSLLIWIAWSARAGRESGVGSGTAGKLTIAAYVATFLQIVLGGIVRHTGAAAACTDMPLCLGRVWPAGAHPTALVHMSHRLAALVVAALVVAAALPVIRSSGASPTARALASLAIVLIGVQITLGIYVVTTGLDVATVTAHLGAGALLLGDLLLLRLALSRRSAARLGDRARVPTWVGAAGGRNRRATRA